MIGRPCSPLIVPRPEEIIILFSIADLGVVSFGQIAMKRFYHGMNRIRYYVVLYFMRDGGGAGSKILWTLRSSTGTCREYNYISTTHTANTDCVATTNNIEGIKKHPYDYRGGCSACGRRVHLFCWFTIDTGKRALVRNTPWGFIPTNHSGLPVYTCCNSFNNRDIREPDTGCPVFGDVSNDL